jgi:hypothetical protein
MGAAAHNPEFAKEHGIDQKVAKEFNEADQKVSPEAKEKLPERKKK